MNPRLTYISVFTSLVAVALVLLWAARVHEAGEARIWELLGNRFSAVLEEEFPQIETGPNSIRALAGELQKAHSFIEEIVVVRIAADGRTMVLYPPGYTLDHPNPMSESNSDLYATNVHSDVDGRLLGTVFFRLGTTRAMQFNVALACVVVLLAVVASVGLAQVRWAGLQVRKTRIALEERERQLIHMERLALVGRATAALLHDLKKPVINIRDEIQNLPEGTVREALEEETRFFLELIRDWQLEGFVAMDRDIGEFLDINELINRSLRLASYAQGNVIVDIDLQGDLPDVLGQRQRLVQVFNNIILNAYQAMEGKGHLHIVGKCVEAQGARWIQIDFLDTGPGVPPERAERIFDPFVSGRDDPQSTGLGLYIVRTIVEGMGGKIWLDIQKESRSQKISGTIGAAFHVRLPLSTSE